MATARGGAGYSAFLSYSHALDRTLAPALQVGLEQFGRTWFRKRALRVFRDDANLAASPNLWHSIVDALASSEWFILLASPDAARSPWVTKEVEWWLENRDRSRIMVGLTAGEISWCSDGDPATHALPAGMSLGSQPEPRWVDLRHLRSAERTDPEFQSAVAELAAPLHGVPKDQLIGEHVRQSRARRRWISSAVLTLVLLTVTSVVAALVAVEQQRRAEEQTTLAVARQLASAALANIDQHIDVARLLAVEGYRLQPNVQTRSALLQTALASPQFVTSVGVEGAVTVVTASPEGAEFVMTDTTGNVTVHDDSGRRVFAAAGAPAAATVAAIDDSRRWVVAGDDSIVTLWDRAEPSSAGPARTLTTPDPLLAAALTGSGEFLALLTARPGSQTTDGLDAGLVTLYHANGLQFVAQIELALASVIYSQADETQPHMAFSAFGSRPVLRISSGACARAIVAIPNLQLVWLDNDGCTPANSFISNSAPSAVGGAYFHTGSLTLKIGENPARAVDVGSPFPFDEAEQLRLSPDLGRVAVIRNGIIHVAAIGGSAVRPADATRLVGASGVTRVEFLRGSRLVSAGSGGLQVWDTTSLGPLVRRTGIKTPDSVGFEVQPSVAMSPDSRRAAIADEDGVVHVLDLNSAEAQEVIAVEEPRLPISLAWNDGGHRLIIMQSDGTHRIWGVEEGLEPSWTSPSGIAELPQLGAVAFDPAGLIRATDFDGTVYSFAGGAVSVAVPGNSDAVDRGATALSSDGRLVARATGSTVELIDVDTGTAVTVASRTRPSIVAFIGSDTLLVGQPDGTVSYHATTDGTVRKRIAVGNGGIGALAASDSVVSSGALGGEVLVSTGDSGERIGKLVLPTPREPVFTGRQGTPTALGVAPDGSALITATSGDEVLIWRLTVSQQVQTACESVGRDLTEAEWRAATSFDPPIDLRCGR